MNAPFFLRSRLAVWLHPVIVTLYQSVEASHFLSYSCSWPIALCAYSDPSVSAYRQDYIYTRTPSFLFRLLCMMRFFEMPALLICIRLLRYISRPISWFVFHSYILSFRIMAKKTLICLQFSKMKYTKPNNRKMLAKNFTGTILITGPVKKRPNQNINKH